MAVLFEDIFKRLATFMPIPLLARYENIYLIPPYNPPRRLIPPSRFLCQIFPRREEFADQSMGMAINYGYRINADASKMPSAIFDVQNS
jgi:hypothetical protein